MILSFLPEKFGDPNMLGRNGPLLKRGVIFGNRSITALLVKESSLDFIYFKVGPDWTCKKVGRSSSLARRAWGWKAARIEFLRDKR